jgi:glycosyltransferase involved in cell wall biosynthesis
MKLVLDNIMTTGFLVSPEAVAEKLEMLYRDRDLYETLSTNSIAKFSSEEYSWKAITKQWVKLFEEE